MHDYEIVDLGDLPEIDDMTIGECLAYLRGLIDGQLAREIVIQDQAVLN